MAGLWRNRGRRGGDCATLPLLWCAVGPTWRAPRNQQLQGEHPARVENPWRTGSPDLFPEGTDFFISMGCGILSQPPHGLLFWPPVCEFQINNNPAKNKTQEVCLQRLDYRENKFRKIWKTEPSDESGLSKLLGGGGGGGGGRFSAGGCWVAGGIGGICCCCKNCCNCCCCCSVGPGGRSGIDGSDAPVGAGCSPGIPIPGPGS